MQKWEYCILGPIVKSMDGSPKPESMTASKTTFSKEEKKVKPMGGDGFLKYMVQLGLEGWELVGTGNTGTDSHFLYFKRPIEE